MEFGILGPLEVRAGPTVIDIRRGHPRALLTALVLRAGSTVSAASLTELLWRDDQPRNPANALQILISYLRKVLAGGTAGGGLQHIVTRPGGYVLDAAPEDVDAIRFERAVLSACSLAAGGTAADLGEALSTVETALGLWRGEPLADLAGEPFAAGEITRLEELHWSALETRIDVLLGLGRHRELVAELGQLVADNPLRERFQEQLMLALYRCGRQADALRCYEQARTTLVEELGLNPGPAFQQLERQVLAQEPCLDWVPPAGAGHAAPGAAPAGVARSAPSLPTPVSGLVGREAEAARVCELLAGNRLVTLTGPGGTGKSRLALEVARADAAASSVWFVDFGALGSSDLVAPTVAAALGVPTLPEEDAVDAVARALSRQQGLLVLDTCEHVITGAADLVARVLRESPAVRVLATSRRALRITGEIAWPVPPLALPPPSSVTAADVAPSAAVALFAERASQSRPGFEVTDANAADVAAICLALDGLPLAIELAAARADVLTPAAIRARLQNRFDLLVEGGRDLAARQQTLRSAIDWSFELLDPEQRRFFLRLGVFPGSFGLDAAIAVAGEGFDDPFGLLAALARQSMVVVIDNDRYRMLDTLRAYATALHDQDVADSASTRRRHAEFFTARAEQAEVQIRGAAQGQALEELRDDLPSFRAALSWSFSCDEGQLAARLTGALTWFWALSGMFDEAIQHHDRAIQVPGLPPLVRAKVLAGIGLLAASLGYLERSRAAGAESVLVARQTGDRFAIGFSLNALAVAEWALGDLATAAAIHDEAIQHFQAVGDLWGRAICTVLRARTAFDAGDPDVSSRADRALALARASGDQHVVGLALEQIARARLVAGDVEGAVTAATEALAAQRSIGYTEGTIAALHLLGESRAAAGQQDEACELHLSALELSSRIGHAAAMCEALEDLARIAVTEGAFSEGLRLLGAARNERRRRNLPLRAPDQAALDEVERAARAGIGGATSPTPSKEVIEPAAPDLVSQLLACPERRHPWLSTTS